MELAPPNWGGWIGVDGKHLHIGARGSAVLMIAVDQATADIVNATVVATESGDVFAQLITEAVTEAAYPLRGVVADLGPGAPHWSFPEATRRYFGALPFQACRVHLARRLDMNLSTPSTAPGASRNAELRTRIRSILFAATYTEAVERYWDLAANDSTSTGIGPMTEGCAISPGCSSSIPLLPAHAGATAARSRTDRATEEEIGFTPHRWYRAWPRATDFRP
jgi:hypothetical protein